MSFKSSVDYYGWIILLCDEGKKIRADKFFCLFFVFFMSDYIKKFKKILTLNSLLVTFVPKVFWHNRCLGEWVSEASCVKRFECSE